MDFLCGYRTTCVWHGDAINFLEDAGIGWGNAGTLISAALDGDVNTASHKTYRFSDRLMRGIGEDIDILVVGPCGDALSRLKAEVAVLEEELPLHMLYMQSSEARRTDFVAREKCVPLSKLVELRKTCRPLYG